MLSFSRPCSSIISLFPFPISHPWEVPQAVGLRDGTNLHSTSKVQVVPVVLNPCTPGLSVPFILAISLVVQWYFIVVFLCHFPPKVIRGIAFCTYLSSMYLPQHGIYCLNCKNPLQIWDVSPLMHIYIGDTLPFVF